MAKNRRRRLWMTPDSTCSTLSDFSYSFNIRQNEKFKNISGYFGRMKILMQFVKNLLPYCEEDEFSTLLF